MAVDLASAREGATAAAGRILDTFSSKRAFFSERLCSVERGILAIGAAFRVAHVGLDDLDGEGWLIPAGRTRLWRVVVTAGTSPVAAVDFEQGEDGRWQFITIKEGPLLQEINDALMAARDREEFQAGSFEPVLLGIPAADMVAIWFRQRDGDSDRLLLVKPASAALLEPEAVRDMAQRNARRSWI